MRNFFKLNTWRGTLTTKGFTQHLFPINAKHLVFSWIKFSNQYFRFKSNSESFFRLQLKKTWRLESTVKGFTIMEMLVVLGLIALFSAMIAANYSNFRQTTSLKGESEKLTSLVRKAQLWALTGQTRGGIRPPGGWGVHIEECTTPPCSIFLFADMSPSGNLLHHLYDTDDQIVTEIYTQQHVEIFSVFPIGAGNALDLVFTSPTSTGYFNGNQFNNVATIVFRQTNSDESQEITVNRITNQILLAQVQPPPQCSDGIDNDGIEGTDLDDPDCNNDPNGLSEEGDAMVLIPISEIVFKDTFTQNDAELTTYMPDIGSGWQQIYSVVNSNEISGSTLMANGALSKLACGADDGALYKTIDVFDTPNYLVEATFENDGDGNEDFGMLAARIRPSWPYGDMYLFQWDTGRGQLFLRYRGAWLQLGEDTEGVEEGGKVSLTVYGNRISVSKTEIAGTTLLINEIDNTLSSPGSAGVGLGAVVTYNAECSPRLDDFKVTKNIFAPPAQCNDGLDNDGDGDIDFGNDADCSSLDDSLEYASLPQVIPEFYDAFNATADTVLDDQYYPVNVGPLIGSGWLRIISAPAVRSLIADEDEDTFQISDSYNSQGVLYQTIDTISSPDYEVSARYKAAKSGDDYVVLAARIQGDRQMYAVKFNESDATLRVKNGTWLSSPQVSCSGCVSEGDTVTLKTEGTTISVLSNGAEILSMTDNTIADAGRAGIGMGAIIDSADDCVKDHELDDFKVLVTCDYICLNTNREALPY